MSKFLIAFCLFPFVAMSQLIDCQITINSDLIDQTNKQIFETLERDLNEFVNTTSWVDQKADDHNKIQLSMVITVENYKNNNVQANLQIQSSRPVFNTTYTTVVMNRKDDNFSFDYQEFESLNYNPNNTNTNLVALMSFYVYVILGMDADTFSSKGGAAFYDQARKIVDLSQRTGFSGWKQSENRNNRYWLIDQLTSPAYDVFREVLYDYHRLGLDQMHDRPDFGKNAIAASIKSIRDMTDRSPNLVVVQNFFDAKSDEIVQIFSGGPNFDTNSLVDDLNRVAPFFTTKWSEI